MTRTTLDDHRRRPDARTARRTSGCTLHWCAPASPASPSPVPRCSSRTRVSWPPTRACRRYASTAASSVRTGTRVTALRTGGRRRPGHDRERRRSSGPTWPSPVPGRAPSVCSDPTPPRRRSSRPHSPRWPTSATASEQARRGPGLHRVGRRHDLRPARAGLRVHQASSRCPITRPVRRSSATTPRARRRSPTIRRSWPASSMRSAASSPTSTRTPSPPSGASTTTRRTATSSSTGWATSWSGAATSGHGFKFGPLLGELLADLADGARPRVDLGPFRLLR